MTTNPPPTGGSTPKPARKRKPEPATAHHGLNGFGDMRAVADAAKAGAQKLAQRKTEAAPGLLDGISAESKEKIVRALERMVEAPNNWPDPVDFLAKPAAPLLVPDLFPPLIGDYAWARAQRAGHDPGVYAMNMLTAVASAIDDRLTLAALPETNFYPSARLWFAAIGRPSVAKTPGMRAACEPLMDVHMQWAHEYDAAKRAWDEQEKTHKTTSKAGKNAMAAVGLVPKPVQRFAFMDNVTKEALSDALMGNPRSFLMKPEEIDSWLGAHDAYKAGGGSSDRGDWLITFDGGPHQVGRVGRGFVLVPNWGVSIMTATTINRLQALAKKLQPDGLFARFLTMLAQIDRDPDSSIPEQEIAKGRMLYTQLVAALFAMDVRGCIIVNLSSEAREVYEDWCAKLRGKVAAMETVSEGLAAHLGKGANHLARLALTDHAVETGFKGDEGFTVQAATMRRAIKLLEALWRHSGVVYMDLMGQGSSFELARDMARSLLASGQCEEVTPTHLSNCCRAFRDADTRARREGLEHLVVMGWLRVNNDAPRRSGEPSRFEVNPQVWGRFERYGEEHRLARAEVLAKILG